MTDALIVLGFGVVILAVVIAACIYEWRKY